MNVTMEQVLAILYQCIEELNEQRVPEQHLPKDPEAVLLGETGTLDSLAFVNFIALAEEHCERELGAVLMLTDNSPSDDAERFETVGRLATHIHDLLGHTNARLTLVGNGES